MKYVHQYSSQIYGYLANTHTYLVNTGLDRLCFSLGKHCFLLDPYNVNCYLCANNSPKYIYLKYQLYFIDSMPQSFILSTAVLKGTFNFISYKNISHNHFRNAFIMRIKDFKYDN